MKIVDNQNRKVLNEGRSEGVGFAFAKLKDDTFETVMPISPCKDYLNDVVYVENTGKEIGMVYGFDYKVTNCINKNDYSYLIAKVMGNKYSEREHVFQKEEKALIKNHENIKLLLNYFEDLLEIKDKSKVEVIDNMLVLYVSEWWCEEPWRISFYTLMMRNALNYDGKEDVIKFLTSIKGEDGYMLPTAIKTIQQISELKKKNKLKDILYPLYDKELKKDSPFLKTTVHNAGIMSVKFK